MSDYSLLIFDWDGTLMDSSARIVACFQAAARDAEVTVPDIESVRQVIGLSLDKAWRDVLPEQDHYAVNACCQHYASHFMGGAMPAMPFFEGVREGLEHLDKKGWLLSVATGKSRRGLDRVLASEHLATLFATSRCADETFSKPHPQMLFDILDKTGCSANDAIMIGDTTYDLDMANNAGMASIGVSYGMHSIAQLEPIASLGLCHTPAQLFALLDSLELKP